MLDKFQRVRHGLLYNPEGRRERVFVKLKGALQFRIVLGSGKFSQRSLGYYSIFSSQSLPFIERAQKVDCKLAVLAILQPGFVGANNGRGEQAIFSVERAEEQMETLLPGPQSKRISDHTNVYSTAH